MSFHPTLYPQPAHIYIFPTESFAATGWRVGWLIGHESILKPTLAVSTRIVFSSNSPLQEAAAAGLERAKEHDFFAIQTREYAERRDVLTKAFDDLGMKYTLPQGSYFILLVCRSTVPISPCHLMYFLRPPFSFKPIGYIRSRNTRRFPIPPIDQWKRSRLQVRILQFTQDPHSV